MLVVLPQEIITEIGSYVREKSDINALYLTCREMISCRYAKRDVYIKCDKGTLPTVDQIRATLKRYPFLQEITCFCIVTHWTEEDIKHMNRILRICSSCVPNIQVGLVNWNYENTKTSFDINVLFSGIDISTCELLLMYRTQYDYDGIEALQTSNKRFTEVVVYAPYDILQYLPHYMLHYSIIRVTNMVPIDTMDVSVCIRTSHVIVVSTDMIYSIQGVVKAVLIKSAQVDEDHINQYRFVDKRHVSELCVKHYTQESLDYILKAYTSDTYIFGFPQIQNVSGQIDIEFVTSLLLTTLKNKHVYIICTNIQEYIIAKICMGLFPNVKPLADSHQWFQTFKYLNNGYHILQLKDIDTLNEEDMQKLPSDTNILGELIEDTHIRQCMQKLTMDVKRMNT